MMKESVEELNALCRSMGIPDNEAGDRFRQLGEIEHYAKGEQLSLYRNGQPQLYLLLSGCTCCAAATSDGRGILECICYRPSNAVNPVGMFTGAEVNENCVCLTDSSFATFPLEAVKELVRQDMTLMRIYSDCLEAALEEQVQHKHMLSLRSEARYEWYLENYAEIAEQIPMRIVAQFLNIDPATLSRIRGKIKADEKKSGN